VVTQSDKLIYNIKCFAIKKSRILYRSDADSPVLLVIILESSSIVEPITQSKAKKLQNCPSIFLQII